MLRLCSLTLILMGLAASIAALAGVPMGDGSLAFPMAVVAGILSLWMHRPRNDAGPGPKPEPVARKEHSRN